MGFFSFFSSQFHFNENHILLRTKKIFKYNNKQLEAVGNEIATVAAKNFASH